MEDIKYHPLIGDGSSPELIPMFMTEEKPPAANHKFYLEEIIPHYYRFCSSDAISNDKAEKYEIHCPYCGKVMAAIASPSNTHKHALYACPACGHKA